MIRRASIRVTCLRCRHEGSLQPLLWNASGFRERADIGIRETAQMQ